MPDGGDVALATDFISREYQPIENYGMVGDLCTVAMVGMDGSIDFMCFPYFDSPTIFGALLDREKGGRFQIAPVLTGVRKKQLYLPDSNVLLTRFLSGEGVAEITDFMPVEGLLRTHRLIRIAKAVRGQIHFRMVFAPRFDYARARHRIEKRNGELLFISEGDDKTMLRLRCSVPVSIQEDDAVARFTLSAGESASFLLELARPGETTPGVGLEEVWQAFRETVAFWRRWVGRSSYRGRWREMVRRSALTLKMLTSSRHGSMVAAPTFGLPEEIGGERNWDYRYTWIRDASFTLYGLMRLGYMQEASAFMKWLEKRCAELEPDGSLQIMYGLDGRHQLPELVLPHLEGYCQSAPVRIGNGAATQLQLDIYGELMDSVYIYNRDGEPITYDFWKNLVRMIDWVCDHWHRPDEGIWEVRGGSREFLYSRLMCWVAVDRGLRLASVRKFPAPTARWERVRAEIRRDIYSGFWNRDLQSFVQYRGAKTVDASTLLMPLVKFISPNDPHWFFTLSKIEELLVEDSLVFRYRTSDGAHDGLQGEEGTFTMCSFWYVECIARSGNVEKARLCFEKALGYSNHLGLYAEELGPCGEHLGNFPQAFTHLALISAAYHLDRTLSAME